MTALYTTEGCTCGHRDDFREGSCGTCEVAKYATQATLECPGCHLTSRIFLPLPERLERGSQVRVTCRHCDRMELVRDDRHRYGLWKPPAPEGG